MGSQSNYYSNFTLQFHIKKHLIYNSHKVRLPHMSFCGDIGRIYISIGSLIETIQLNL